MPGKTYEHRIILMLDYFDATGANPEKRIANPTVEVERQVERVVKILRSIETKKIDPLLKISEKIYESRGVVSTQKEVPFSAEELEQIAAMGEQLKKKDQQISELETTIRDGQKLSKNEEDSSFDISDFQEIKSIIENLEESKMSSQMARDSFLINRNIFTDSIKKITQIVSKYVR